MIEHQVFCLVISKSYILFLNNHWQSIVFITMRNIFKDFLTCVIFINFTTICKLYLSWHEHIVIYCMYNITFEY